jgi:hypothetical protein
VLRKGCHFCEDSAPFYQRIFAKQQQDGSNTAIVAAFPDAVDAVKEVVKSERLDVQALAGVPLASLQLPQRNTSASTVHGVVQPSGKSWSHPKPS